ncbi:MAG: CdaR family protein [Christensenellaceae bacterium]
MKKVLLAIKNFLKEFFTKNWGMKIAAIVFAFLLWSFNIAESNPPRQKTFDNIPVTFAAAEELKQKGLVSSVPLSELLKTASVTAEVNADALKYLNEDMISVTVDTSPITDVGDFELSVKAITTLGKIINVTPKTVKVNVEEIATRDVPVEVQLTGTQKDWLYYGEPVLEESSVKVNGAKSNVEKVAKAVCKIDINSIEAPSKESRKVVLLDEQGNELPNYLFTGVPSVIAELPVYPKKEVPIDVENIKATTSGIAEGYEITNVTLPISSVMIAGKLENIEAIEEVTLEPIMLENAIGDVSIKVKVHVPQGVVAVSPTEVEVDLSIAQPKEKRTYDAMDISVKNLRSGLKAMVTPESVSVDVYGTKEAFAKITAANVKPFVDLVGLSKGVHSVPIKFENLPDLNVRIEPVVSSITVTIS